MRVTVAVPTYNRRELVAATIASIGRLTRTPDETIVVSDGSSDGTDDMVSKLNVTMLRTDRAGPSGARNAAWQASSSDVIAFVDDDCVVEPGWLDAIVKPFADPAIGLVQGRTCPAGPTRVTDRTINISRETGLYESCNIAYRRAALEQVNGFDPAFGVNRAGRGFAEDTDLAWRMRRAGWGTAFVDDAVVLHHVFPGTIPGLLREEWRRGKFPTILRRFPEMRPLLPAPPFGFRPQSTAAQLALAGALAASWQPTRRIGLAAMAPYGWWLLRRGGGIRGRALQASRDTVASVSLIVGSLRERTLLL